MKNLTPNTVLLQLLSGEVFSIPPEGTVATVEREANIGLPFTFGPSAIPVVTTKSGDVIGLPDNDEPVIVTREVMEAAPYRRNTFSVDDPKGINTNLVTA